LITVNKLSVQPDFGLDTMGCENPPVMILKIPFDTLFKVW